MCWYHDGGAERMSDALSCGWLFSRIPTSSNPGALYTGFGSSRVLIDVNLPVQVFPTSPALPRFRRRGTSFPAAGLLDLLGHRAR